MGIFDRFPHSSTHEMNLDFMLGKAEEIADALQEVTEGLTQIDTQTAAAAASATLADQRANAAGIYATQAYDSKEDAETASATAAGHVTTTGTYMAAAQEYKNAAAASASASAASAETAGQYVQAAGSILQQITTDGQAQVAAIEAKGEETLASIPDDYTALSSTVAEHTTDIADLNTALIQTNDNIGGEFGGWVVGHVTSNGFTTDTKYGMSNVIHAPKGSKLIVDGGGYYFNVFALTKVGDSGVITSDYAYSSTLVSGYLSNPVDIVIENETYLIIDCRNGNSYSASTNIDISAIPIVAKLYAGLVLGAYNAPLQDGSVTKEKTAFWVHEKSANLFNPVRHCCHSVFIHAVILST